MNQALRSAAAMALVSLLSVTACSDETPPIQIDCSRKQEGSSFSPQDDVSITCSQGDVIEGGGDAKNEDGAGGSGGTGGGTAESKLLTPCVDHEAESKCTTSDGAPGWCVTKYWKPGSPISNNTLVCLACDDPYLSGGACPPGCTPTGDICQATEGSNNCGAGCCPICY